MGISRIVNNLLVCECRPAIGRNPKNMNWDFVKPPHIFSRLFEVYINYYQVYNFVAPEKTRKVKIKINP